MTIEAVDKYRAVCDECGARLHEHKTQGDAYSEAQGAGWRMNHGFNFKNELVTECKCYDCLQEETYD